MESTIIGNNVAPSMPDIEVGTSLPITINRCLIGNTSGALLAGSNNLLNVNPLIDILRDNGGPSMTCLLLPGSPAIDAGSNPAGLQYDQRGVGFPRVVGAAADIGAAEGVLQIPVGQDITPDVSAYGPTTQTVTVKYFDAAGIAVSSLGTGDIVVEGPGGFSAVPIFDGVDVAGNGSPRVATYHFTPPGGAWDTPDNGTYTVRVVAGQVANINGVTAPAEQVGSFNVAVYTPINFVVTNTLDSGAGSLRQAVLDAKANLATDSITFAPLVAGTITLTSDLPILEDGMTIIGPGASQLAITRPTGRAFEGKNLTLERMTIRDTDSSNAAVDKGAVAGTGKMTLRDCSFINNFAFYPSAFGGAVYLNGELLAERCNFQGNSVTTGGGALAVSSATIRDSSFAGNYIVSGIVATAGGAIYSSGTLLLEGCNFTGNSAPSNRADGGAIWFNGTSFTARNCLFAGNSARSGGALALFGPAILQNCTVVGNSASLFTGTSSPGGGIRATSLTLESTVVTGNSDNEAPDISASGVKASRSLIGSPLGFGYVDQGGNIPTGTPAQLDGSYVPLLTSPLINAGANPANLTNDVRGTGFARVRGKATDIGAYENQNVPATVSGVTINGGAAQRSRLFSVTVAFDRVLDLSGNPFRIARQSDGLPLTFTVTTAGTSATLIFTGATPVPDGRYTLQVLAAAIPGSFDGNGDITPGDDYTLVGTPQNGLFRLYGDSNGDGRVDSTDFLAFRLGLSANNPIFDADGDGVVGPSDFLQFRLNFLRSI
ncbi:MAG: right-handed parallel beta-helix repeat-containing protein [Gemmataceae bacterium]|nr:right-handed parallel beta-helix repeat-containing protein [Gemmataceae bacterium]